MSSAICYKDQFCYVSNKRFDALVSFAIEVGENEAKNDEEVGYVETLKYKRNNEFWNGYDLYIEKDFSATNERKFWARCLFNVAHLIFNRKFGNNDISFWQASAIGDAYIFARMLTRSVQEEELGWHPETIASIEADIYLNKGLNIKV